MLTGWLKWHISKVPGQQNILLSGASVGGNKGLFLSGFSCLCKLLILANITKDMKETQD